jgi:phosphoglycolate phosphatase-like HAD superfamily hydrolase
MAPVNHKLVLFDIDGTLIHHLGAHRFQDQYEIAIKRIFGVDASFSLSKFNGTVDRHNSWEMVKESGVTRKEFIKKFPAYVDAMHEVVFSLGKIKQLYEPIPSAKKLVQLLHKNPKYLLGVMTGNAKRIALWKLEHTGLLHYFSFGLYGDEADDRIELAKLVFRKAKQELHITFSPQDIIVIGDTVHDIRCGKAIGSVTIGVTSGLHGPRDILSGEHPDMIVDTLMDKAVLDLFSIK